MRPYRPVIFTLEIFSSITSRLSGRGRWCVGDELVELT